MEERKTMKTTMMVRMVAFVLMAFAWVSIPAFASNDDDSDCQYDCDNGGGTDDNGGGTTTSTTNDQDQDQSQGQDQYQGQDQGQDQGQSQGQDQTAHGGAGGEGTANNEGIDVQVDASDNSTTTTENNSSNIVLVPNNNTENCLRVWGLAFGKNGESAALGLPFRSKKCDYEQAADDAFAQGERELGWFWKCENSNLSKSFKDHDDPSAACLNRMLGGMSATTTITTMTETIETLLEEARSRDSLYKRQAAELKTACSDEKNRMLAACMNTK